MIKAIITQIVKFCKIHLLFFLIILFVILTRFINLYTRYSLGVDSIRDASVAIYGATHLQLPLTGPFSSLGSFTFGPWYWYLLIFFYLLFPSTYSPWVFITLSSIFYIFIIYKIGKILVDKFFGLILAFMATFSRYLISTSVVLTNPSLIHLFSALSIWIFLLIVTRGRKSIWWSFLLGITIGIGINIHFQMLPYIIFIPSLLFFPQLKRFSSFLAATIGTSLTFLPLLFFDLINQWYLLKNIYYSYSQMGQRIYVPNSWKIYLFQFWPNAWNEILGTPQPIGLIILIISGLTIGWLLFKKKLSLTLFILLIIFSIMFVQLRYYTGERFLGYIHYLIPFILIISGLGLWQISKFFPKKISWLIIVFYLGSCLPLAIKEIQPNINVTSYHQLTQALINQYPDTKFRIFHCKDTDWGSPVTLYFLLLRLNKLSDQGEIIAFADQRCPAKTISALSISSDAIALADFHLLRLSSSNPQAFIENGWEHFTPEFIYRIATAWWFDSRLK